MSKSRIPSPKADREIKVAVKPFGPRNEELADIGAQVLTQPALREFVGHGKARLLYVEALDEIEASKVGNRCAAPTFRQRVCSRR